VLPRGGAPFHPRCTKRYVAFNEKLASAAELEKSKPDAQSTALSGQSSAEAQRTFNAARRQPARSAQNDPPSAPISTDPASVQQVIEQARSNNWSNRQIKDALFALGLPGERDAVLAALGRARGPAVTAAAVQPIAAPAPVSPRPPPAPTAATPARTSMRVQGRVQSFEVDLAVEAIEQAMRDAGLSMSRWSDMLAAAEKGVGGLRLWVHPKTGERRIYAGRFGRGLDGDARLFFREES
jgi:hypothetical protein